MKFARTEDGWIIFWCPGCEEPHSIPIAPHPKGWALTGTDEAPTLAPSILVFPTPRGNPRCHFHIASGVLQYLQDCGHALKNSSVPMVDWKP